MWYLNVLYQWVLVFIAIILIGKFIINPIMKTWARHIAVESDTLIRDTKYDEKTIIAHLDYIILEVLDAYELLHIQPKNVYYINGKLEQEVLNHVSSEVSKRVSKTLLTQLAFIYDESYIGTFIGTHVYFMTVDYVLTHNLEHADENETNKMPMAVQTTNIGDAL